MAKNYAPSFKTEKSKAEKFLLQQEQDKLHNNFTSTTIYYWQKQRQKNFKKPYDQYT